MDHGRVIRDIFVNAGCSEYVGIDRGPVDPNDSFYSGFIDKTAEEYGVDMFCDLHETIFLGTQFDTMVCASVLEHDPDWKHLLEHNLQWLRRGGLALISFGAEGNDHHAPEPWAIVPRIQYLEFVRSIGLVVLDEFFEEERYQTPDCPGGYASELRKA